MLIIDAVSRQDSLNMAYKLVEELASSSVYWDELKLFAKEQVQSLPPVTPKPKTGYWIDIDDSVECSECGHREHNERFIFEDINYCPNCGADMREKMSE